MLIVLRGNSGSGKSTVAKLLREAALERDMQHKIAIIEQDYLRRVVLREKDINGGDNIELVFQTAKFALEHNYDVIIEGILNSVRYKPMLSELFKIEPAAHLYYFDISIEETLLRHATKQNSHEFGEKELRAWYTDEDLLGYENEIVINQDLSQSEVVKKILSETKLVK